MRVFIDPTYTGVDRADGGIRRVSEAMVKYLPDYGWQVTADPDGADLIVNHGAALTERPGVPMIAACHGLMWSSYGFGDWGDKVNKAVIETLVRANAITAPSKWVAQAISRGMLAKPTVVYHGVDADDWQHDQPNLGYVLWNKARVDEVSDPEDMHRVADFLPQVPFLSTFGDRASNVMILGTVPYEEMRPIVQRAGVYLATARETFGIGTLEALAAGVPVAGWRYGGQEEIVIEGETGYLADYGDYEGLAQAIIRCLQDRDRLSRNCVQDARARWGWQDKIAQYAALFTQVVEAYTTPRPAVSVIITTHNLARYLEDAIGSVVTQTMKDWECIVVDDASTDDPHSVVKKHWDDRFSYRRTPENLKLSGARNYGFSHARGRYILFFDADDLLAPNALDTLATALDQHTDIHIAYGHLDTFNGDNPERTRGGWPGERFNWQGQIAHLNQLPYAAMMRREVLERSGGYRTRDWRAEDASLWTRLTSLGFRAEKVTEDPTLIYRFRSDSKGTLERREHADIDGDWTAWYPWRLAGTAEDGEQAIRERRYPNPQIVPFAAQGTPPRPLRCWPVHHHQHPAISVIIPVGPGHAEYLIDALDSVQAQTMPLWECIVVNDTGMPLDATGSPWARVIDGGGLGAGAARNRGLVAARAPLTVFLDADDILIPNALESMLQAYLDSDGRYIYGDWVHLEDETRMDGPGIYHETPDYDPILWLDGMYVAVTCLIPTADLRAVGGFDEKLPAWEDWDLMIKLTIAGVCGQRLAQPTLVYRRATGKRRQFARDDATGELTEAGQAILDTIKDRYYAYGTGATPMASCCGGNTQALEVAASAMRFLDDMMGVAEPAAPPTDPNAPVRLEYIGDEWGEQVWFSQDRQRQYKAGRDPHWRYVDADPRDVAYLLSLDRKFGRVKLPDPEPELVAAGDVEDEPPRRQRGRRA